MLRWGSEGQTFSKKFRHVSCVAPSEEELRSITGWNSLGDDDEVQSIVDMVLNPQFGITLPKESAARQKPF